MLRETSHLEAGTLLTADLVPSALKFGRASLVLHDPGHHGTQRRVPETYDTIAARADPKKGPSP